MAILCFFSKPLPLKAVEINHLRKSCKVPRLERATNDEISLNGENRKEAIEMVRSLQKNKRKWKNRLKKKYSNGR